MSYSYYSYSNNNNKNEEDDVCIIFLVMANIFSNVLAFQVEKAGSNQNQQGGHVSIADEFAHRTVAQVVRAARIADGRWTKRLRVAVDAVVGTALHDDANTGSCGYYFLF